MPSQDANPAAGVARTINNAALNSGNTAQSTAMLATTAKQASVGMEPALKAGAEAADNQQDVEAWQRPDGSTT